MVAASTGIHIDRTAVHECGGFAKYAGGLATLLEHAAVATIAAVIAGRVAQQRVNEHASPECWADDDAFIEAAIQAVDGWPTAVEASRIHKRLEVLAEAPVVTNWPWITRTAEALLRKRCLAHADILRLRPGGQR